MECRFYSINSRVIVLQNKGRVATTRNSFDEIKYSDGGGSSYRIGSCDRAEFNLTCFHHTSCKDHPSFAGQAVASGTLESQVFMENSASGCPKAKESYRAVVYFSGDGGTPKIEVKQNNISHCRLKGHTAIEFYQNTKSHCSMNKIFKNELDDVYFQVNTNEVKVERENIMENKKNTGSRALFYNGTYTVESCVIISNEFPSFGSSTFAFNEFYGNSFPVPSEAQSMPSTYSYEHITDWACMIYPFTPSEAFSLPKKIKIKTQFVFLVYNSWKE